MDLLRTTLSELASDPVCLEDNLCQDAFDIKPATEHTDSWHNYIETRNIFNAFDFAVEQS